MKAPQQDSINMDLKCGQCQLSLGPLNASPQGKQARCESCGFEFVVPFHEANAFLAWAEGAPWPVLEEGLRTGVALHMPERIVRQWIRLFEKRREREIWRLEREEHGRVRSRQERLEEALEKRHEQERELEILEAMSPVSLRRLVVDLFQAKGFSVENVETSKRKFRDFAVSPAACDQEGIVRCVARGGGVRATARDLKNFAASCTNEGWSKGYLVTSGRFTKNARAAAVEHPWLTLHDGESLLKWVQRTRKEKDIPFPLSDYDPAQLLSNLKTLLDSKLISREAFEMESAWISEDL